MKKVKSVNEVAHDMRRTWGLMKPVTKVFKSKKAYNRNDKTWIKGE